MFGFQDQNLAWSWHHLLPRFFAQCGCNCYIYSFPTFGWGFGTWRQNSFYSLSIRCDPVAVSNIFNWVGDDDADNLELHGGTKGFGRVWSMTKFVIWLAGVNNSIETPAAKNQFNFCWNLLHKELGQLLFGWFTLNYIHQFLSSSTSSSIPPIHIRTNWLSSYTGILQMWIFSGGDTTKIELYISYNLLG